MVSKLQYHIVFGIVLYRVADVVFAHNPLS